MNNMEQWIEAIAGNVEWKQRALHEALEAGYEIRLAINDRPIELKEGEMAFEDNGIIGILRLREEKVQAKLEAEKKQDL